MDKIPANKHQDADCMTEVENFPICAGADEVMYHVTQPSDKKFCCKKGQIGVIPLSGYTGICRDASSPPAASLLATVVSMSMRRVDKCWCQQVAQYGATAVGPNPTATNSPATAGTSATPSSGSINGNSNGVNGANSGSQTGPAGAGPTTIINNSQSSSSSSASASANASSGSSLSTGAIAGIAVGAAGLIGIILALGWFYRSGKFSKKEEPSAPAPVYTETKDSAPYQQNATAYTRSDSGGVNEWKSPASQYSEIGGSTVYGGGSGVVSPMPGRNELSP